MKGRVEDCTYGPCSGGSIELKSRRDDPLWDALVGVLSFEVSKYGGGAPGGEDRDSIPECLRAIPGRGEM